MPITRSDRMAGGSGPGNSHLAHDEAEAERDLAKVGLQRFHLVPPVWRRPLQEDDPSKGYPGVYPPHAGQQEDLMSRSIVQSGWSQKPLVMNETFSLHQMIYQNLTNPSPPAGMPFNEGAAKLYSMIMERRRQKAPQLPEATLKLPGRATLNEQKRENWLRELAEPSVPLFRLSRNVPHGFKGEKMLDMLVTRKIPPDRAVWYLKAINIADIQAQRKKSNVQSRFTLDWTIEVGKYLSVVLKEIALPSAVSTHFPGMKTKPRPSLLLNEETRTKWTDRFGQICALVRCFQEERLIDRPTMLFWLIEEIRRADLVQLPFVLYVHSFFEADFPLFARAAHGLAEAALAQLGAISKSTPHLSLTELDIKLKRLLQHLFMACPDNFVSIDFWPTHRPELHEVLVYPADNTTAMSSNWPELREVLIRDFETVDARVGNLSGCLVGGLDDGFSRRANLLQVLDEIVDFGDALGLYNRYFVNNRSPLSEKLDVLLSWATTPRRKGDYRGVVACNVLELLKSAGVPGEELQKAMIKWLEESEADVSHEGEDALVRMVESLARQGIFSPGAYFQRMIARGESELLATKGQAVRTLLAEYMPLAAASKSLLAQQRRSPARDSVRSSLTVALGDIRSALCCNDASGLHSVLSRPLAMCSATSASRKIATEFLPTALLSLVDEARRNEASVPLVPSVVAWGLGVFEGCKAFGTLHDLIAGLLDPQKGYVKEASILCVLSDTILACWPVFAATGQLANLVRLLFDAFVAIRQTGNHPPLVSAPPPPPTRMLPIRRQLLSLVHRYRRDQSVDEIVSWLAMDIRLTAGAGGAPGTYGPPPPLATKEFESLLAEPSVEKGLELVSSFCWNYSSYNSWAACLWSTMVSIASTGTAPPAMGPAVDPSKLVSVFVSICEDLDSRMLGGLEAVIQHATALPTASPVSSTVTTISPLLQSLLKELVAGGVLPARVALAEWVNRPLRALALKGDSRSTADADTVEAVSSLLTSLIGPQPAVRQSTGSTHMEGLPSPPQDFADGAGEAKHPQRQSRPDDWLAVDPMATQIFGSSIASLVSLASTPSEGDGANKVRSVAEATLKTLAKSPQVRKAAIRCSDVLVGHLLVDLAAGSSVRKRLVTKFLDYLWPIKLDTRSPPSAAAKLASLAESNDLFMYRPRLHQLHAHLILACDSAATDTMLTTAIKSVCQQLAENLALSSESPARMQAAYLPATCANNVALDLVSRLGRALSSGDNNSVLHLARCLSALAVPLDGGGDPDQSACHDFWGQWAAAVKRAAGSANTSLSADALIFSAVWVGRLFPESRVMALEATAVTEAIIELAMVPSIDRMTSRLWMDLLGFLIQVVPGAKLAEVDASLRRAFPALSMSEVADDFPLAPIDRTRVLFGTGLRHTTSTLGVASDKAYLVEDKPWFELEPTDPNGPGFLSLQLLGAYTISKIERTPPPGEATQQQSDSDEIAKGERDNFEHELNTDALSTMPLHFLRSLATSVVEKPQERVAAAASVAGGGGGGSSAAAATAVAAPWPSQGSAAQGMERTRAKRKAAEELAKDEMEIVEVARPSRSSSRKKAGKGKRK